MALLRPPLLYLGLFLLLAACGTTEDPDGLAALDADIATLVDGGAVSDAAMPPDAELPPDAMVPTCTDAEQNGDEEGVDCGGSCDECVECTEDEQCDSELCGEEDVCLTSRTVACTDAAPEDATSAEEESVISWTAEDGWTIAAECDWSCDTDFDELDGECVNEQTIVCSNVAPGNATSTLVDVTIEYTSEEGWSAAATCEWDCNQDFDEQAGGCISEQSAQCTDAPPTDATSITADVVVTYTTASGWSTPANCEWNCNLDFDQEDGACVDERTVQCSDESPANGTSVLADVSVVYTTAGGWATPATCQWSCDVDFDEDSGTCTNERNVACSDASPANASAVDAQVSVSYTTAGGWAAPTDCAWNCNLNYDEQDNGTCINQRVVACTDASPANATSANGTVTVNFTTANGWSEAATCEWSCNLNFDEQNGACINQQSVSCADASPANATSVNALVGISYTTAGGWSDPAACAWSCNLNFDEQNGACINQQSVSCADESPANASSVVVPVTVSYTTANGWGQPAACAWNCNLNFDEQNGACINQQSVSCADESPANATSVNALVGISYTTANGWSQPGACAWNCNLNFEEQNNGTCINQQSVSCADESPANATSANSLVGISYTTAGGWSDPAACAWSCNLNFDEQNGTCVNQRVVSCTDESPANASSVITNVTVTYSSANGWSDAAACEWSCDLDYQERNNGTCINERVVSCRDDSPVNATSVNAPVVVTYTTANGWSQPATCDWNCDLDYDERNNGTCINQRVVACTNVAPANATSFTSLVTVTYSTANGWSQAAACEWQCNFNFDEQNGACINELTVECIDRAPDNSTAILADVVIEYFTGNGWSTPADCEWSCNLDYCAVEDFCEYAYINNEVRFQRTAATPLSEIGFVNLGVTNGGVQSRGIGQSVVLPAPLRLNRFAVNTVGGFGEDVEVMLQIRNANGGEMARSTQTIPASFTGGWMWIDMPFDLQADMYYIFTLHVPNALTNGLQRSVNAAVIIGDAYEPGTRYSEVTTDEIEDPLDRNWQFGEQTSDLEFWLQGDPACAQ